MPRRWRDLTVGERFALALEFLKMVGARPDLTVGRLREEFARAHDLAPETVRHLDDLLWFSDFVRTAYRGVPPRPYRVLTPWGEARVREGAFTHVHLPAFPEWVRRSFGAPAPAPPRVLKFVHGDFSFWLEPDWKFRVYVEGPDRALQPWQAPLDPARLAAMGISIPSDTMLYVVKNRALILLDTIGVQASAGASRMYQVVGYRWVPMDENAKAARISAGRVPARDRHFIVDPRGVVRVWRVSSPSPGRSRYCVDLSSVGGLPPTIDTAYAKGVLEERVPRGVPSLVSAVWD